MNDCSYYFSQCVTQFSLMTMSRSFRYQALELTAPREQRLVQRHHARSLSTCAYVRAMWGGSERHRAAQFSNDRSARDESTVARKKRNAINERGNTNEARQNNIEADVAPALTLPSFFASSLLDSPFGLQRLIRERERERKNKNRNNSFRQVRRKDKTIAQSQSRRRTRERRSHPIRSMSKRFSAMRVPFRRPLSPCAQIGHTTRTTPRRRHERTTWASYPHRTTKRDDGWRKID